MNREMIDTLTGSGEWYEPLLDACALFEIDTDERVAMFLAQCMHESQGFTRLVENLNYSASGLLATFPKYFDAESANEYARKPVQIANRVYAGRMGNGDEASGDGWKNRGRGPMMITGAHNLKRCGQTLGVDLLIDPDLLLIPRYGALSAGWIWDINKLNAYADADDFIAISGIINVGRKVAANRINGMDDRLAWLDKTRELMA